MPRKEQAAAPAVFGKSPMSHKFHVDQAVEFSPEPGVDPGSRGRYTIISLLPLDERGAPQYRLKNAADGHERIAQETQLGPR
jgi:hypothetical protein